MFLGKESSIPVNQEVEARPQWIKQNTTTTEVYGKERSTILIIDFYSFYKIKYVYK